MSRQCVRRVFVDIPLSGLRLVIHSLGVIVMSSISQLANLFRSPVLEFPVVGSNFPESFVHASLVSPYILDFSLPFQQSESRPFILV